jgi:hypothetical protein
VVQQGLPLVFAQQAYAVGQRTEAQAELMKRADRELRGVGTEPSLQALTQLASRFAGEGDGADLVGARAAGLHQVLQASDQGARLARAGSGDHQRRGGSAQRGLRLRRGQLG